MRIRQKSALLGESVKIRQRVAELEASENWTEHAKERGELELREYLRRLTMWASTRSVRVTMV